jgi:hypothetical protein
MQGDIRVTRSNAQELCTSTLDTAWVSCRSFRIRLVSVLFGSLAIIAGIAVDEDTNHAQLLSALDLEATEDSSILGNGDLALEVNTSFDEILEVLEGAVVDVNDGSSNISAGSIAVEDRDSVLERCRGVLRDDIFFKGSLEGGRPVVSVLGLLQERNAGINRVVDVNIIRDDF